MTLNTVVIVTMIKAILHEGRTLITLTDIEKSVNDMNAIFEKHRIKDSCTFNKSKALAALDYWGLKDYEVGFFISYSFQSKLPLLRGSLDVYEEIAIRHFLKGGFTSQAEVKAINNKILERLDDPVALEELTYWRLLTLDYEKGDFQGLTEKEVRSKISFPDLQSNER